MSKRDYLAGRVTLQTLPYYEKPPGHALAPELKRLALAQGELAQFWNSDAGARYIAAVEIIPGATRGNHLHRRKEESIYVIAGKMLLIFKDPVTSDGGEIEMTPGALVRIATGVAHALVGVERGWAIECSPALFDPTDSETCVVA